MTASIDEKSSQYGCAVLRNGTATSAAASAAAIAIGEQSATKQEEKKTSILKVVKGNLESFEAINVNKQL